MRRFSTLFVAVLLGVSLGVSPLLHTSAHAILRRNLSATDVTKGIRRVGTGDVRPSRRALKQFARDNNSFGDSFNTYKQHLRTIQQNTTKSEATRRFRRNRAATKFHQRVEGDEMDFLEEEDMEDGDEDTGEEEGEEEEKEEEETLPDVEERHDRHYHRTKLREQLYQSNRKKTVEDCHKLSRTRRARCFYDLRTGKAPDS